MRVGLVSKWFASGQAVVSRQIRSALSTVRTYMPNIGPLELIIVLIIALVVFGPKRLPELGRSMGKGIREFRGTVSGECDDRA